MNSMNTAKSGDELAREIEQLCEIATTYRETVKTVNDEYAKALAVYSDGKAIIQNILRLGKQIGLSEDTKIYRSTLSMAETTVKNAMNTLDVQEK